MRSIVFSKELLKLDCARETERIVTTLRECVLRRFKKRGLVVAISGGIDSSVVAALAVRAFGAERVLAVLMPEKDSCPETLPLSREVVESLKIASVTEDITRILEAAGCYRRRDDAIRLALPDYTADWKSKIVLPSVAESDQYRLFALVAQSPEGSVVKARLPLEAYLGIVAASNFKQRTRKMLEYYHADRLNYAVSGTPNRLEYDQGFFVKGGDGAADVKPIAHLYKTQVYQMAEYLKVPDRVRSRPPSTDTYSLPQSQEEFYFSVPFEKMDLIMYGKDHGFAPAEIGTVVGLDEVQVGRVFRDIDSKRRMAHYLHSQAVIVE